MPGLGEEFRAAREARHLSLSDVSEQIHIRSVYLQSIESEEWSSIAAPVYVRGFIRSYARFLGLDSDSAVERLNAMLSENASRSHEPAAPKPVRTRSGGAKASSPSPWLWLSLAVAVALVLFVGYRYLNQEDGSPETAVAVASPAATASASSAGGGSAASSELGGSASPDPSASPAQTASSLEPKRAKQAATLVVSITQRSWLLVKVDGTRKAEGIYPPGTIKEFHGKSASIRAGNGGGVDLTVNGKAMGPLGAPGSVVDKTVQLSEE